MRIDAVQIIKDRITMRDVLDRYGYDTNRRIPCPLHGGKDSNFEHKGHSWRCYSHCGSGDEITFIQTMFGLSFTDALKKIDTDFGMNIYSHRSFEEIRRIGREQQALQAKREREKRERQRSDEEYWTAFDEWKRLDDNRRLYKPKSPDEELHPLFVESLQKLEYQKYILGCLDERRSL